MTNTNCLAGIACPACGNDAMIYIAARTLAVVTDDGAQTFGDMEWDADSYAECPDCQHRSTLGQFRTDAPSETTTVTEKE
jgi:DNA-directed RNA polymerase subunit RPC12/RpoP